MALLFTSSTLLCQALSLQHQASLLLYQITFAQTLHKPFFSPWSRFHTEAHLMDWAHIIFISRWKMSAISSHITWPIYTCCFAPHWNEWVDFLLFSQSFISFCFAVKMETSDTNGTSSSCCQFSNLKMLMGFDSINFSSDYLWPIFFQIDELSVWWAKCHTVWIFLCHTPPTSFTNTVADCCLLIFLFLSWLWATAALLSTSYSA